jgi:hypothetical protein
MLLLIYKYYLYINYFLIKSPNDTTDDCSTIISMTTAEENVKKFNSVLDTKIDLDNSDKVVENKTNFNIREFVQYNLKKIIFMILPIFYLNEYFQVLSNDEKIKFFKNETEKNTVESNDSLIKSVFSYLAPKNLITKILNLNQRHENYRFGFSPFSQFLLKINHFNFF